MNDSLIKQRAAKVSSRKGGGISKLGAMTPTEFAFLKGDPDDNLGNYYEAGLDCYEAGWIDDLGFVTPKGANAMKEYERG